MMDILRPDSHLLYMKVGSHASEPLDSILERKLKEIDQEGFAFWGYGGSSCHPINVVQPFAKSFVNEGNTLFLCMEPMDSKHFAAPVRAEEFSVDGIKWEEIPEGINCTGSRYAVVIKNIQETEIDLALSETVVASGNSSGLVGSKYIKGRVDKACLMIAGHQPGQDIEDRIVKIGLVAEVVEPYAVFVRNVRK